MSTLSKLPEIIILYGPPACGKGTQADFLSKKLPDYYHLDFGTELRNFVTQNIGNYNSDEIIINPNTDPEIVEIAKRIKQTTKNFLPVDTADLRFVIGKTIVEKIDNGHKMLIEGPGRKAEEAMWLCGIIASKNLNVAIFHLHLHLEETIKRSTTRFYIPSQKKPFPSYQTAKAASINNEEPYQRSEDSDSEGIKKRYESMYANTFAEIISIYQLNTNCRLFTIDAAKKMPDISNTINLYIQKYYQTTI